MIAVTHLKRTYLERTETFIHMQVSYARQARASILCRQTQNLASFPGAEIVAFSSDNGGKRVADLAYDRMRMALPHEQRFYRRSLVRLRPRLLHAHFAVDAAYFLDLARWSHLPLVVSCYGYDVSSFPRRYCGLARWYLDGLWRETSAVLAMSNDMRRDLLALGCPKDRIVVHYYGVDLSRFLHLERPYRPETTRIAFVGSLGDERKGVDDAIRAFGRLAGQRPDVELRLIGDGKLRHRYERLVRELGLAHRVSFAGFVPHDRLADELRSAHVFLHPSVTTATGDKEGIPGTIVEAMATGMPVVTTRHAGIPEMVTDEEHGYVVSEHDIAGLARALERLVASPELRARLGEAAAVRARERADALRQTDELESIYTDILASRRDRLNGR